ncbi:MAG: hypothetical protein ABIL58_21050 [Pseudomonadota bacterium]
MMETVFIFVLFVAPLLIQNRPRDDKAWPQAFCARTRDAAFQDRATMQGDDWQALSGTKSGGHVDTACLRAIVDSAESKRL